MDFETNKRYEFRGQSDVVFLEHQKSPDGDEQNCTYYFARRDTSGLPDLLEARKFTFKFDGRVIFWIPDGDEFAGSVPCDGNYPINKLDIILRSNRL